MIIQRPQYLNSLISKRDNGFIKIITGLRRCGKSYLLFNLYRDYLINNGVDENCIIELKLDEDLNVQYRDPLQLGKYVRQLVADKSKRYYVFLDEIQKVAEIQNPYIDNADEKITFVDTLLGLKSEKNIDLYITGSNSKMLSSEILTEFKDRGIEIKMHPLSYKEFYDAYPNDKRYAWREFIRYGGMPAIMSMATDQEKSKYLKNLFEKTYLTDVVERHKINNNIDVLENLLDITASAVGSLTNPKKISDTFKSILGIDIKPNTITTYIKYFIDAFLMSKANRYDIKGRKYIGAQMKYYYSDIGLRNARLNFRQVEENPIMENIIYNELETRDFNIDVGVVEYNKTIDGKNKRIQLEIDFIANRGDIIYYIQSALTISEKEKREQETNSLRRVPDSFRKIVVVGDNVLPYYDNNGVYFINIEDFLLDYIDKM